MSDRPIIFSAPMVCALLDGRKTQTRRMIKPQPVNSLASIFRVGTETKTGRSVWNARDASGAAFIAFPCHGGLRGELLLRFSIGDRLWVKEALQRFNREPTTAQYVATLTAVPGAVDRRVHLNGAALWEWQRTKLASMFMPRWASRLTLTISDVRVQRLQDISDDDARAEGVKATEFWHPDDPPYICFSALWDSIHRDHGKDSWRANPWIVAITFTVEKRNIDEAAP